VAERGPIEPAAAPSRPAARNVESRAGAAPSAAALRAWARHLGAEPDPDALRAELAAGTLTEAFHRTAERYPDRPALAVGGVVVTHGELDERAGRLGRWLRERGVERGDRVLVAGASSVDLVAAYLGVLRAGAAMVPADPGSTGAELEHLVADSGAVVALTDRDVHGRLPSLRVVAALGEAFDAEPLPAPGGSPGDLAMVAHTSGTTGRPKGVPLTHANLLASLRAAMRAWRWTADEVLVHALPLSHQHGLSGAQMGLLAGSRAVLLERFDPERLCRAIEDAEATVVFAVPAMYERLLGWDGLDGADLGSVRLWVSGSAPLSPRLAERVAAALGELPLERYGSTEAGLCVSNLHDGPRRAGSVGFPLPGLELALAEGETEGEILLRGPQVFGGYWQDDDATADAFTGEGWFRTGDVGRLDPDDGSLAITGRLKEMILSGGLNVSPREVELVLEEHAAVRQAAVVGRPSEQWGEEVVAFVVPAGGEVDPDALLAHARERLSRHKCPKQIFPLDALPAGDTGKVRREELVEMAMERDGED
jgi:malonyl-CoA/methylmalonyl-CoA synthetase